MATSTMLILYKVKETTVLYQINIINAIADPTYRSSNIYNFIISTIFSIKT